MTNIESLPVRFFNPVGQKFKIFKWRIGQNAMAQIDNPVVVLRKIRFIVLFHMGGYDVLGTEKQHRIDISLQAHF